MDVRLPCSSGPLIIVGSGFTKAVFPDAPLNTELVHAVIEHSRTDSVLRRYRDHFDTNDIELLLTRLDLEIVSDPSKFADREQIEGELVSYFRKLRFSVKLLDRNPWLLTFATKAIAKDTAIIDLNYDCFLEGLLDYSDVWSPKDGYAGVDNILVEGPENPKGIVIYKIHGSEHFRISKVTDRPEQDAIAFEFDSSLFPHAAANSHFGGGIDSKPYVIAPSFVKLPHRQIAGMMIKLLELSSVARTLIVVGCGLRREDSFLWLLLTRFLGRREPKNLVLVDPKAASLQDRINRYWLGDLNKYAHVELLSNDLEASVDALSRYTTMDNCP